jgi:polysaccharide export outer membrane protein
MTHEIATPYTFLEDHKLKQSNICSKYLAALLFLVTLLLSDATAQQKSSASASVGNGNGSGGFASGAAGPIGAGDLVEMSVFDTPELSGKLRVSNTGDIILPLVGQVHVAGLTANDVETLIRQRFIDGGFVRDPQVTVFIVEYATQGVSVLGEVRTPGIYPALGPHNLVEYISIAGGLTPLAGTTITITRSGHPDESQQIKISSTAAPNPLNNPEIFPGDSIFVEKTGLIYVIGDVVRPGGFPMDHNDHLTILQAIALAQGTTYSAKKSSSVIIRSAPQGRETIPVDLKKILASKAADEPLQDNDILFVPNSSAKTALKNAEAILPIAASATIYRVP